MMMAGAVKIVISCGVCLSQNFHIVLDDEKKLILSFQTKLIAGLREKNY